MSNQEIAALLCEYRKAKTRVKEVRAEMMKIAVTEMGMDQKHAKDAMIEDFLDGYLIGQGVQQSWRNFG